MSQEFKQRYTCGHNDIDYLLQVRFWEMSICLNLSRAEQAEGQVESHVLLVWKSP